MEWLVLFKGILVILVIAGLMALSSATFIGACALVDYIYKCLNSRKEIELGDSEPKGR